MNPVFFFFNIKFVFIALLQVIETHLRSQRERNFIKSEALGAQGTQGQGHKWISGTACDQRPRSTEEKPGPCLSPAYLFLHLLLHWIFLFPCPMTDNVQVFQLPQFYLCTREKSDYHKLLAIIPCSLLLLLVQTPVIQQKVRLPEVVGRQQFIGVLQQEIYLVFETWSWHKAPQTPGIS